MLLRSAIEIRSKLTDLVSSQRAEDAILAAVAYWGEGSQDLFPANQELRLLCRLGNGTNPYVIQEFRKRNPESVKQNPRLHAKVVIASNGAILSSANMSSNGLKLDADQSGWHEIGILIQPEAPEYSHLKARFWELWCDEDSEKVTGVDIDRAIQAWGNNGDDHSGKDKSLDNHFEGSGKNVFFRHGEIDPAKQNIKMASDKIEKLLGEFRPDERPQEVAKIAAFAANVMWTALGREIDNNLPPRFVFMDSCEVLDRAKSIIGRNRLQLMIDFFIHLSNLPESNDADLAEISKAAKTAVNSSHIKLLIAQAKTLPQ